jgi:Methyltransferase FkbM domain
MSLFRRKNLKAAGVRLSGGLGWHSAPRTQASSVRGLVQALRPLEPGVELIRIGPENDGGYLVPDDLDGIRHAFSPGVSNESGFEAQLADRGMQVFLADHSVDGPAIAHPRFVFDKRFVGSLTDERYITLDDWHAAKLGADSDADLVLQMDIEGAEYETLLAASPRLLGRFRIMVIEFHWLPQLWNEPFFAIASRVFAKLLAAHAVVHIHPNNCCGSVTSAGLEIPRIAEFTLLRRDRLRSTAYRTRFPHPLDRPNVAKKPLLLAPCWYS